MTTGTTVSTTHRPHRIRVRKIAPASCDFFYDILKSLHHGYTPTCVTKSTYSAKYRRFLSTSETTARNISDPSNSAPCVEIAPSLVATRASPCVSLRLVCNWIKIRSSNRFGCSDRTIRRFVLPLTNGYNRPRSRPHCCRKRDTGQSPCHQLAWNPALYCHHRRSRPAIFCL